MFMVYLYLNALFLYLLHFLQGSFNIGFVAVTNESKFRHGQFWTGEK